MKTSQPADQALDQNLVGLAGGFGPKTPSQTGLHQARPRRFDKHNYRFFAHPLYDVALLPAWYTSLAPDELYPAPDGTTPYVWKNMTNDIVHEVAPGQVALHPGNDDRMAIVRWTSPLQTELSIVGQFWAGDLGEVDVFVLETTAGGTTTLFSVLGTPPSSQSFRLTTTVKAGDAIDFVVGCHGQWFYDSTPLNVDITPIPTPIPEPLTMASAFFAIGGLGGYIHRRMKSSAK